MTIKASIAIVGGGVMGVSLLYHLSERGWKDLLLLEKNELTAGSTWHAAGLCTHFAHNATIMLMRARSVALYRDILPDRTGNSVGFHSCGALRVTRNEQRMEEFRHVKGLGQFVGFNFNILNKDELKEIYPLCTTDELIGAIHEPDDGFVDPSLATHAMAGLARENGARIVRNNPVRQMHQQADGKWLISTEGEDILADQVVNAAGTWCREIADMMGVDIPVVPMLHQYLVTDSIPELSSRNQAGLAELPMIRDPEESWYLRQEHDGYILGPYEKQATPWSVDGVPENFGMELLPANLDPLEHIIEAAMARVPVLTKAGIKTVVNGPITFTPDANPLVGPAFGLTNAWLLTGSSMGIMEGGGAGSFLADWMTDGTPPTDALAIDARRFGGFADRSYRLDMAIECFGLQFGVHFPFEERPAARNRRVTEIKDLQEDLGGVFGCAYGWERVNWFQGKTDPASSLSFKRSNWFSHVERECLAVQNSVGLGDLSAFSKFTVLGEDAEAFMQTLGANSAPTQFGSVRLCHALTPSGGIASEFSVIRVAEHEYYLVSAAVAERHDEDLLRQHIGSLRVNINNVTEQIGILSLMGPNAADMLSELTNISTSFEDFPWLTSKMLRIDDISFRAIRVSYVGESGFELHIDRPYLRSLWQKITRLSKKYGLAHFAAYAMNSMRLEKGYKAWGMDLTTERTPFESSLGAFVKIQNRNFTGRDALIQRNNASPWSMVLLELEPTGDFDPFYAHPVFLGSDAVGIITSGGFGHRTEKRLGFAYLNPGINESTFHVEIVGNRLQANVLNQVPYDASNNLMKGAL